MTLEYLEKYNESERRSAFATIDEPVVIFMGLTIADMLVAVMTFLAMAMLLDSPFLGLILGVALAFVRKEYGKRFTRGSVVHWLWSRGILRKKNIPHLFDATALSHFSP